MNFLPPPASLRALCAAALLSPLAALAADLSVNVADGPATEATLYVALYDSAAAFAGSKSLAAQTLPLRAGTARLQFSGLPPGRYALRVFADENGNGKLDTNPVGLPIERYGFSNDAKGNRGAPDFEAAALNLESANVQTVVHLR
ncbi:DUF2141 domain-containing protein [Variovorax beijingensis]|uniref:DUF2141 domain-containing protein n=1 Tax=Variovorax beijingensis TaxID=2496117 RepID=A0A3P3F2Q9_9BURK|nr:DUF2141 domain-containing protein [Variovorax beijingensis]RRH92576.1 DUF2141 domain-containing protein [Variovorax beijingensis]RSZ43010.1 DUF2141 domain-containing protein [Variovorax beijingensis]